MYVLDFVISYVGQYLGPYDANTPVGLSQDKINAASVSRMERSIALDDDPSPELKQPAVPLSVCVQVQAEPYVTNMLSFNL